MKTFFCLLTGLVLSCASLHANYPPSARPWNKVQVQINSACRVIPFNGSPQLPSRVWVSVDSDNAAFHADVYDHRGNVLRSTSGLPKNKVYFRFVQTKGYTLRICKTINNKSSFTVTLNSS